MARLCIVGISGRLGQHLARLALARGHEVAGVCRPQSAAKLDGVRERIALFPGATNDPQVIRRAVEGCDAVLTVLVPWGMEGLSTGTAQAVLDHAPPGARLVFSCGWHVTRDSRDVPPWKVRAAVALGGPLLRLLRIGDIADQEEACRRVFASDTRWTVVRASDLEDGESQGLPIWRPHVGHPALASNRTRRVDLALFMLAALEDESLIRQAPAIVGCGTPSALRAIAAESG